MSERYEPIFNIGQISCAISFDPADDITWFMPPMPRQEFLLIDEASPYGEGYGDFTRFAARANPEPLADDGTMGVDLTDCEVVRRKPALQRFAQSA